MKDKNLTPINKSIEMMQEFREKVLEKFPRESTAIQAIDHCISFAKVCMIDEFNAMFDAWLTARFTEIHADYTFRQYYENKYEDYASQRTDNTINE